MIDLVKKESKNKAKVVVEIHLEICSEECLVKEINKMMTPQKDMTSIWTSM